jgi:multidrug transporter EmrE-like cation transporter
MGKIPVIILLILSSISVTTGDFFAKYWSLKSRPIFYVLAIIGYIGSAVFYIPTVKRQGLVVTSLVWALLSTLGLLAIGLLYFKETLTPLQKVGVVLATIALLILEA